MFFQTKQLNYKGFEHLCPEGHAIHKIKERT